MKSLLAAFAALLAFTLGANAQCASGYTQLSNVFACQSNSSSPVITSPSTASGIVGTAFSYTITATNSPTSFSASGLPSPLTVNTSTGVISGTPTAASSGNVTLGATNGSGTGNETLALTISAASHTFGDTAIESVSNTTGTGYSYLLGPWTNPTSGALQSVSLYCVSGSGTTTLAVYDNSSPHNRVAITAAASVSTGWNTIPTTTNPTLTAGGTYWFGVYSSAGPCVFAKKTSASSPGNDAYWQTGTLGSTYSGNLGSSTERWSVYGTVTP